MERLKRYIEWLENGQGIDRDECLSYLRDALCDKEAFHDYEATGLTLAECAKLAAAKRDGRLAVLPCKRNDVVYDIRDGTVYATRVLYFSFFEDGKVACRTVSGYPDTEMFGIKIFLTPEEAEAALAAKEANPI